jgi:hypothetical protein
VTTVEKEDNIFERHKNSEHLHENNFEVNLGYFNKISSWNINFARLSN